VLIYIFISPKKW